MTLAPATHGNDGTSGRPHPHGTVIREQRGEAKWWIAIIVALIGLAGAALPLIVGRGPVTDAGFIYSLLVLDSETGEAITDSRLFLNAGTSFSAAAYADGNGSMLVTVPGDAAGSAARLVISAEGYGPADDNVALEPAMLPGVVRLERLGEAEEPTPVDAPIVATETRLTPDKIELRERYPNVEDIEMIQGQRAIVPRTGDFIELKELLSLELPGESPTFGEPRDAIVVDVNGETFSMEFPQIVPMPDSDCYLHYNGGSYREDQFRITFRVYCP